MQLVMMMMIRVKFMPTKLAIVKPVRVHRTNLTRTCGDLLPYLVKTIVGLLSDLVIQMIPMP